MRRVIYKELSLIEALTVRFGTVCPGAWVTSINIRFYSTTTWRKLIERGHYNAVEVKFCIIGHVLSNDELIMLGRAVPAASGADRLTYWSTSVKANGWVDSEPAFCNTGIERSSLQSGVGFVKIWRRKSPCDTILRKNRNTLANRGSSIIRPATRTFY